MSITTTFDFTDPSNYTLSNVDVSGSLASLSLVPNPGLIFSQSLTSSTGFTLNSSKTQITGGVLSQVDHAPATLEAYFSWNTQLAGNYGSNPLSVAAFNGAAISGSVLNLTGSSNKYVTISPLNGAGQVATFAFVYTPSYSGNPAADQIILSTSSTTSNYLGLIHGNTGPIGLLVYDSSNTIIIGTNLAAWTPVSGQSYTFVLQLDLLNGATKLFIDGVQLGATQSNTGVRTTPDLFYIGRDFGPSGNANFSISTLAIYSTIVNESTATPLEDTKYLSDLIVFPLFNYSGLGTVVGFSGFATTSDVNEPRYTLNSLYWNGSMWVSSDLTYAKSNPKSVIAANIGSFPNNNSLRVRVVTQSGNVPMSITGPLVVTYSGEIYPVSGGTILSNSPLLIQQLLSFVADSSESGSDTVSFALKVNNVLTYWDGTAWVPSDGTYAQTNSPQDINDNAEALISVNSLIKVYALLKSGTGSTTPNLTSMTLVYKFGATPPNALATTVVYGFLSDIVGNPVSGAQIIFSLVNKVPNAYMAGADHILIYSSVTATTDDNGYFEKAVIATTQFQGENTFIQVVIKKSASNIENVGPDGLPLYLTIPVQATIDITTLLTA